MFFIVVIIESFKIYLPEHISRSWINSCCIPFVASILYVMCK
jgi:hypothetical protein